MDIITGKALQQLITLLRLRPMLFRESLESDEVVKIESESELDDDDDKSPWLLCSRCGNRVTKERYSLKVNSKSEHTFFNPQGVVFNISCFKRAEGCALYGEPTTEFSWFGGYRWQYALCSGCHLHLGWRYISSESSFFGLIRNLLIEEEG